MHQFHALTTKLPSSMGEEYVNIYVNETSLVQEIYLAYNKYRA